MNDPADVINALRRGPATVAAVLESVPATDLKRRPAPARWSAHEHAVHLSLMEPIWATRVESILANDNPEIISYDPDADEPPDRLLTADLTASLAAWRAGRERLLERLGGLQAADWDRPARHSGHARYSLFLMCRHMALHDMLHAYRIEESALGTHWPDERPDLIRAREGA